MHKKLVMGVFDAEKFWRGDNVAVLPGIQDQSSVNIINVMDELLFPFCTKDDVLITAKKMNDCHKDYLNTTGFSFTCNSTDLDNGFDNNGNMKINIFENAFMENNLSQIEKFINTDTCLSPYAVIPYARQMCSTLNIQYPLPDLECVKAVNSKIYSNALKLKLGLNAAGEVVYDSGQLLSKGQELLKHGAFLIKDEYGVSGKGNILITSERILSRIAGYLKKQEENQKCVRLLLEPFLDKQLDFSCSVVSDAAGGIRIESAQKINNNGFNYAGTGSIGADLYRVLEEKDYFNTVETIAGELYKDGYFGEIGIDSMMLKDGDIVPLIEINARKTMGMANNRINLLLDQFNLEGQLSLYSVGYTQPIEFEQLLFQMKAWKILFEPGAGKGIIPLSTHTLLINSGGTGADAGSPDTYKGRFYYSAAAATGEERLELIQKTCDFLKSSGFKIY